MRECDVRSCDGKMNRTKLKIGLALASVTFLAAYAACFYGQVNGKTVSDTVTLSPLEKHAVSFKMNDADTLYISGDVTSGTVDVFILDSENYPDPYYYEEAWYDLTSTFTREFEPLWSDTFYVVIYNPSTTNPASVSYTFEHDAEFLTGLIINLSVSGALLGAILVTNYLGKK
jgi:hypothetical protein